MKQDIKSVMENYELEYRQNAKTDCSFFGVSELPKFQHKDQILNFSMQNSSTTEKLSNESLMKEIYVLIRGKYDQFFEYQHLSKLKTFWDHS